MVSPSNTEGTGRPGISIIFYLHFKYESIILILSSSNSIFSILHNICRNHPSTLIIMATNEISAIQQAITPRQRADEILQLLRGSSSDTVRYEKIVAAFLDPRAITRQRADDILESLRDSSSKHEKLVTALLDLEEVNSIAILFLCKTPLNEIHRARAIGYILQALKKSSSEPTQLENCRDYTLAVEAVLYNGTPSERLQLLENATFQSVVENCSLGCVLQLSELLASELTEKQITAILQKVLRFQDANLIVTLLKNLLRSKMTPEQEKVIVNELVELVGKLEEATGKKLQLPFK
jgi:hypothetical protein